MYNKFILASLMLALAFLFPGNTEELRLEQTANKPQETNIVARENIPSLNLTVLKLKNGMKVFLKRIESDDDIIIRLTALGGYSCLPPSERASAQFASQVAIRSGVGEYYYDKLYSLLYDHSLEFNSEIGPFSRTLEGTAAASETNILFNLFHLFFTQQHFTDHAFKRVMAKEKEKLSHQNKQSDSFNENTIQFNVPEIKFLKSLTEEDLDRTNYQTSKSFFERSFRDPSEFACVIAGAFDMEQMVSSVNKYFGAIPPAKNPSETCKIPEFSKENRGITKKSLNNTKSKEETITVLTLPINAENAYWNENVLEQLTRLVRLRLKAVLRQRFGLSIIVGVTTEYPFYPVLAPAWIKIQYVSSPENTHLMGDMILKELRRMREEGISAEDITILQRKLRKAERLREKDTLYWAKYLTNYAIWDWDPNDLLKDPSSLQELEKTKNNLRNYFSLEDYNLLSYTAMQS